ncbi:hypothetical protein BU17DRAFT_97525 [Hysterangium stoloniferum]|nr:hypothetical protein BU17DRAFT_97525 [Hysterangium stoloniferum]
MGFALGHKDWTVDDWKSILEDELQAIMKYYGKNTEDVVFQQDNDPKYKSKKATNWFKDNGFVVMVSGSDSDTGVEKHPVASSIFKLIVNAWDPSIFEDIIKAAALIREMDGGAVGSGEAIGAVVITGVLETAGARKAMGAVEAGLRAVSLAAAGVQKVILLAIQSINGL